ncbi:hypothetical protein AHAS_Ahas19G0117600 [Arachis hypogaea]
MEVGDGRRTRFWEDVWLCCGALKDRFLRLFSVSIQKGSVIGDCGFWDGLEWIWNFQWRRELFHWELEIVNQLHDALRLVKLVADRDDRLVWKFDRQCVFTTNSFVQVLQEETLPEDITSYSFTKTIWKGLVPPRVELFAWFVLIGKVHTKERLCRFGIINQEDNLCALCKKDIENVWCAWLVYLGRKWSFPGTVKEHFQSWIGATGRKEERKNWFICYFAIVWNIWLEKNRRIFQNKEKGVEDIFDMSFLSYQEWRYKDPLCC